MCCARLETNGREWRRPQRTDGGQAVSARQRGSGGIQPASPQRPHLRRRRAAAVELVEQPAHGADCVWVKLPGGLGVNGHAHLACLGVHAEGRLRGRGARGRMGAVGGSDAVRYVWRWLGRQAAEGSSCSFCCLHSSQPASQQTTQFVHAAAALPARPALQLASQPASPQPACPPACSQPSPAAQPTLSKWFIFLDTSMSRRG